MGNYFGGIGDGGSSVFYPVEEADGGLPSETSKIGGVASHIVCTPLLLFRHYGKVVGDGNIQNTSLTHRTSSRHFQYEVSKGPKEFIIIMGVIQSSFLGLAYGGKQR